MGILDTNYEENIYLMEGNTIKYDNDNNEYVPETNSDNENILPSYVSINNNAGMNKPTIKDSDDNPFESGDNPNTEKLFGIHIFDKKFGFYDLKYISYANGYPNADRSGSFVNYNGVLTGYGLNGVLDKYSVTDTNPYGNIIINFNDNVINHTTINDDTMTNPETYRLMYTPNSEFKNLHYGKYGDCVECYFYLPTTIIEGDFSKTFEYVLSDITKIYAKTSQDVYYAVSPDMVTESNTYYYYGKKINGEQIERYYISIPASHNNIDIYDASNGLIYYKKNDDNTYERINYTVSQYQYIETNSNTVYLTIEDGYGEDCSENIENRKTITNFNVYKNAIGTKRYKYIEFDWSSLTGISSMKIFNVIYGITVTSNETVKYLNANDLLILDKEYNINHYGIITYFSNRSTTEVQFYINVTRTQYTIDGTDLQIHHTTFEIPETLYDIIIAQGNQYWVSIINTYTKKSTSRTSTKPTETILAYMCSTKPSDYTYLKYKFTEKTNGKFDVDIYWVYNNKYLNGISGDEVSYDNYSYSYNGTVLTKEREINISKTATTINNKKYITLECGEKIELTLSSSGETQSGVYKSNDVNNSYTFSNYKSSEGSGNIMPYPQDTKDSIFNVFDLDKTDGSGDWYWDNIADKVNDYTYSFEDSVNEFFIIDRVGKLEDDPYTPEIYTYSPKYCLIFPDIFAHETITTTETTVNYSKIFVVFGNNLLLKNYDFYVTKYYREGDTGDYTEIETVFSDSSNRKLKKTTVESTEYNGYEIVFTTDSEKTSKSDKTHFLYSIKDCANMNITKLSINNYYENTQDIN